MSEVLIQCPNCGASINENVDKCPFCGYINPKGAEQKYMEKLEDVRLQLDNVDEEAQEEYKKGITGALKVILIVGAIVAVLCVIAIGVNKIVYNRLMSGFSYKSPEDEMKELAYMTDLFKQFDELYESGQYDELVTLSNSEALKHNVWDYEHYPFVSAYRYYMDVRDWYIPHIDKYGFDDNFYAEKLTQNALYFYYRIYTTDHISTQEITPEELEILDKIREDYMLDIVYNRLGYTESELDEYSEKVTEVGYFDIKVTNEMAKKYGKRYK